VVFSNSPRRETPKNKRNRGKNVFGVFVGFGVKTIRHDIFEQRFLLCFELPSLQENLTLKQNRFFWRHGLFAKICL
jgi:hypothetical protein